MAVSMDRRESEAIIQSIGSNCVRSSLAASLTRFSPCAVSVSFLCSPCRIKRKVTCLTLILFSFSLLFKEVEGLGYLLPKGAK